MKKILYVLAAAVALFAIAGCTTGMHDGTSMYIEKLVVTGLPDSYDGVELRLNGNFNNSWSSWNNLKANVANNGTVTFNINMITSVPQVEFLLVPPNKDVTVINNDGSGANWSMKIAIKIGDGENPKVDNTWTGPAINKMIKGEVQSDNSVKWSVVDSE